ncbi:alpha/beta hydrolase [Nocardioides sp. zg-1228]|uniref:alpha/beta hydrolase n=1 Tax=Nocardioides sp. zg-1228 TaxID=2763008 RepID=UPI00164250F8|nr:alpha/beta hydrolase [Nocardioides sp. zg-1228]MBC2934649.1 alpha/beta hydrolase [Nocardioides sp. zg-1228]QSF55970.1 alpha/beta hydrolase [Nocardioides sp. zg-1228]
MDQKSLAGIRSFYASFGHRPLPEGTRTTETTIGGVPAVAITVPVSEPPAGTLLYLHGGGYAVGSAHTGVPLAAALAARAGLRAVSLDYRLAPEAPFPAATDDALEAYRQLLLDVDPARLVLAGDSAGGGLALATVVAARDAGLDLPAGLVALSGWFDLTLSGASLTGKEEADPVFDAADITAYAETYLAGGDGNDRRASPLLADLRGLPPLLLQVGSREVLLDDSTRLAALAATADVDVALEVYAGATHVFHHDHLTDPTAARAVDSAAAFLTRQVGRR